MLHCRFMVHSLGVFLNMYMIRVTLDKGTGPRQIKLWFSLHDIILEGKPIGPDLKKIFKESSWFGESKCKLGSKVVDFIFIFTFFYRCCSNSMKMENMLWIVESTLPPPFWTNFRVDMTDFVNLQKVVARRNTF
jgi:hypothetical protein